MNESIKFFQERVDRIVEVILKDYDGVRVNYHPVTDRITLCGNPPGVFNGMSLYGTWSTKEIDAIKDDFVRAHLRELLNRCRELHEIKMIRGIR